MSAWLLVTSRSAPCYLDQPLTRQLQLLSVALPGLKKAGVPLGPSSLGLQAALQSAEKISGIRVSTARVDTGPIYMLP